jgi:effector-binding domain-containing protein
MTVLTVKAKDSIRAMGNHIRGLFEQARIRGLKPDGPLFTVYYEKPEGEAPVEYELCLPVAGPPAELDKLADMGGDPCLYLRVKGSYSQFGAAYKAMTDHVSAKGYELAGPPREVYVRGPLLGFLTFLPTMVTDIYFPIVRRK